MQEAPATEEVLPLLAKDSFEGVIADVFGVDVDTISEDTDLVGDIGGTPEDFLTLQYELRKQLDTVINISDLQDGMLLGEDAAGWMNAFDNGFYHPRNVPAEVRQALDEVPDGSAIVRPEEAAQYAGTKPHTVGRLRQLLGL